MAYKTDTRKRVKILKHKDPYLNGMIGRLYNNIVTIGHINIPFDENTMITID